MRFLKTKERGQADRSLISLTNGIDTKVRHAIYLNKVPNVAYGTYTHLSIEVTSKDYNDPIKATRHPRSRKSHPSEEEARTYKGFYRHRGYYTRPGRAAGS